VELSTTTNDAVLTCWKDIANYLGKGVRTVQRWEHDLGLPVRRPSHAPSKNPVLAIRQELDDWVRSQAVRCTTAGTLETELERLRQENADLRKQLEAYEPDGFAATKGGLDLQDMSLLVNSIVLIQRSRVIQRRYAETIDYVRRMQSSGIRPN